ncbi:MAG: hypothetical protein HOE90_21325 [Bacteriovoracaceae bacterium]|jgi:hypothetical protein|nr:hypothetical protein [Bacteriovoracaceae bacterium]
MKYFIILILSISSFSLLAAAERFTAIQRDGANVNINCRTSSSSSQFQRAEYDWELELDKLTAAEWAQFETNYEAGSSYVTLTIDTNTFSSGPVLAANGGKYSLSIIDSSGVEFAVASDISVYDGKYELNLDPSLIGELMQSDTISLRVSGFAFVTCGRFNSGQAQSNYYARGVHLYY